MFYVNSVEKIETHFPEDDAVYEMISKNIFAATDDNIIMRMRILCWMTKATHTHRICDTYCFFTAIMVTGTRLNITLYVHCVFDYQVCLLSVYYGVVVFFNVCVCVCVCVCV